MEVYLPTLPFSMHKLPNLFYRLQFQMQGKDVPNYLSDFSQKISAEELAIGSEIKRYKLKYLNKAVERTNVACFVRFSRELQLLIISYCKNISFVAPQNLPPAIQELALLFDDLLSKFQHFSLKYHEKGEHSPQQQKGPNLSQLCAVCSQQMKKVSLEKMRSSLMNELDLSSTQKYEESESGRQEEDAQFFEQVNKLLVMKQGELLKNQVEINNYKDVALNALEFLKTLKGYFARESLVLPSSAWVASAKQEMQNVLRQNFKGKIPPWIGKMLKVFCRHYESEMEGRGSEVGTQTDSQLQAEISQLRRKVVVAREKLHSQQSRVKWQQKQLVEVRGEKGNLQGKIEYYKAELNKLMEEIGNARMENQILTMKLNNARFGGDNNSNAPSNQDVSRDFSHPSSALRMPSSLRCEQGGLPKIKGKSDSKNQRHIRTSIKVNLSSSHSLLQSKKSTRRFDRGTEAAIANSGSVASGHANKDQITVASPHHLAPQRAQRQSKGKNSNLSSLHSRPHSVINEEFGELTMDQYRLKIKEVDQHMKTAIEQAGFSKNRQKHFFSTVSQHSELKRVPRRTLKAEDFDSTHQEPKTVETSLKKNNGSLLRLSKVYNYLSDSGYLIKITQKDFKEQISKLKLLDDPLTQPNSLSNTKRAVFKSRKYIFEKDCFLKRSLYEQSSDQDSKLINDSLDLSIGQNVANNYLMLFISAQNAFVYESNLTKNHSNVSPKLSPAEQHLCQQFYELISQIKADSIEHYKAVCSFIRFPYQVISNSLGSLSLGNDMKYVTFQHYFQRILEVHEKCKKQEGLCQHLREFKGRLAETDKAQPA